MTDYPDLTYATVDGIDLQLDLKVPVCETPPPLVMIVHGGGWRKGSRKGCHTKHLTDAGFAVASISYRLSDVAKFPAQIHDCKAALRWLRAYAGEYGYDAGRVGVMGGSAGGYLVTLLALTPGHEYLDGVLGDHGDQPVTVQAIVDFYGPTDFVYRSLDQPHLTDQPGGTVYDLLGKGVRENLELAALASPIEYVGSEAPPIFIIQGLMDKQVTPQQSIRLYQRYREESRSVQIEFVEDGAHGGKQYLTPEIRQRVVDFFNQNL